MQAPAMRSFSGRRAASRSLRRRAPGSPTAKQHVAEGAEAKRGPKSPLLDVVFVIAGLGMLIFGANMLVTGAIKIAAALGVSDTIIGLTIVAVGTSLPELVTSVMAALRKHSDIAFGNIVGSNIYNVLGILGVTAIIKPIDVPAQIAGLDIWVMLAATALLFLTAMSRWRIGRVEGGIMLVAYIGYSVWLGMNSAA